jgi:hypothetical protein
MGLFDFIRKKTLADQTDQERLARERRPRQTTLIRAFRCLAELPSQVTGY